MWFVLFRGWSRGPEGEHRANTTARTTLCIDVTYSGMTNLKKKILTLYMEPSQGPRCKVVFSHFGVKLAGCFADILERRSTKNYIHPTENLCFYVFIKRTGHRGLNDSSCRVELTIWKCYKNCITNSPSGSKRTFKAVFFFDVTGCNRSCGRRVNSAGVDQR